MQNVKQTSQLKLLSAFFLTLSAMLLLSACSKNKAEIPVTENQELTISNQSAAAQVSNSIETAPYQRTLFVTCANGGAGEEVELNGTIKTVFQITRNDNRFTLTYHSNPQGVVGTGLTTGNIYRASGGEQHTISGVLENGQYTGFTIEQLRIVSPNSTFIVKYLFHVTITPDGRFTSFISGEEVVCNM